MHLLCMENVLCAAVGTASHQHGLEACTVYGDCTVCSCRHSKSSAWVWMLCDRFYVNPGASLKTEEPGLLKLVTNLWFPTSVLVLCSNSCMWTCDSSTCSLFKSCTRCFSLFVPLQSWQTRWVFLSLIFTLCYMILGVETACWWLFNEVFVNKVVGWMGF